MFKVSLKYKESFGLDKKKKKDKYKLYKNVVLYVFFVDIYLYKYIRLVIDLKRVLYNILRVLSVFFLIFIFLKNVFFF